MFDGTGRPEVLNFRSLHRLHLLKCYALTDFWAFLMVTICALSSSFSLLMLLFAPIFVFPPLTPSFLYLPKDVFLTASTIFSSPVEGIWSYRATAGTFVIFGRVLPALCFGWQKLCGSLVSQLWMVSIAAVPCVVPGCGLGPFSIKSCCLCWPNSEQISQLFAKIPLFQTGSWTCVFNTEQEQRGGSQPH